MQVATSDLREGAGGSGPSFPGDKMDDQSWDLLPMTREPRSAGSGGRGAPHCFDRILRGSRLWLVVKSPASDVAPADRIRALGVRPSPRCLPAVPPLWDSMHFQTPSRAGS